MPFLSVIVPIYNVEKYLSECLNSILTQTVMDMEIILVDDGGTDKCPDICDKVAQRDSRVKVIHKQNGGLVSARKAGLQIAKGKYIAFVDGDDSISQDMYLSMCEKARQTGADMVVEGFCYVYSNRVEQYTDPLPDGFYDKARLEKEVYPVMMCHDWKLERNVAPVVWNKLFRRELIQEILPQMDEEIRDGEDAAVTYPCLLLAHSVYFNGESWHYRYRMNEQSISRSYDEGWYASASAYCRWLDKMIAGDNHLQLSIRLEKLRMFYRYLYREYVHCKKEKRDFRDQIRWIRENTEVGACIDQTNIRKLEIPVYEKVRLEMLKMKKYQLCSFLCWMQYIKNRT